MLMWASAASAGCSVCCTVGVTIGTSSSRCSPRPRTLLLGSSIGNSADHFKPRLVSASSGAVCMGSPDPGWRVSPLLLAASVSVPVDSRAPSPRDALLRSPTVDPIQPFNVWISSLIFTCFDNCRASSESVCVQSLLHRCVFITLHELFHACPAFVRMWLRHSLRSCGQSRTSLTFWRRSALRATHRWNVLLDALTPPGSSSSGWCMCGRAPFAKEIQLGGSNPPTQTRSQTWSHRMPIQLTNDHVCNCRMTSTNNRQAIRPAGPESWRARSDGTPKTQSS